MKSLLVFIFILSQLSFFDQESFAQHSHEHHHHHRHHYSRVKNGRVQVAISGEQSQLAVLPTIETVFKDSQGNLIGFENDPSSLNKAEAPLGKVFWSDGKEWYQLHSLNVSSKKLEGISKEEGALGHDRIWVDYTFIDPNVKPSEMIDLKMPSWISSQTALHQLSISKVSIEKGRPQGNEEVIVVGSGFTKNTIIKFGSNPCSQIQFISEYEIHCITPAGEPGSAVSVEAVDENKESAAWQESFEYLSKPNPQDILLGTDETESAEARLNFLVKRKLHMHHQVVSEYHSARDSSYTAILGFFTDSKKVNLFCGFDKGRKERSFSRVDMDHISLPKQYNVIQLQDYFGGRLYSLSGSTTDYFYIMPDSKSQKLRFFTLSVGKLIPMPVYSIQACSNSEDEMHPEICIIPSKKMSSADEPSQPDYDHEHPIILNKSIEKATEEQILDEDHRSLDMRTGLFDWLVAAMHNRNQKMKDPCVPFDKKRLKPLAIGDTLSNDQDYPAMVIGGEVEETKMINGKLEKVMTQKLCEVDENILRVDSLFSHKRAYYIVQIPHVKEWFAAQAPDISVITSTNNPIDINLSEEGSALHGFQPNGIDYGEAVLTLVEERLKEQADGSFKNIKEPSTYTLMAPQETAFNLSLNNSELSATKAPCEIFSN